MKTEQFLTYTIVTDEFEERFTAKCTRPSPRGKYSKDKTVFNYYFKTEERRADYLTRWMAAETKREDEKTQQKIQLTETRKNFINPFNEGDILYDSWGYDQTTIDFFQITKIKNKQVTIQRLQQEMTEALSHDSEKVIPIKGSFIHEAINKKIVINNYGIYIKSSNRGCLKKWDGKPLYQSHSH